MQYKNIDSEAEKLSNKLIYMSNPQMPKWKALTIAYNTLLEKDRKRHKRIETLKIVLCFMALGVVIYLFVR